MEVVVITRISGPAGDRTYDLNNKHMELLVKLNESTTIFLKLIHKKCKFLASTGIITKQ